MKEIKVLRDALLDILAVTGSEMTECHDMAFALGQANGIASYALSLADHIADEKITDLLFKEMLANEESEEDPLEYLLDEE